MSATSTTKTATTRRMTKRDKMNAAFDRQIETMRRAETHSFIDESPINGLCDECGSSVQFHAQPPEHDAGLRDGRRLHTNDCVRQRAKFGARSKAGDLCSCDADAEQPSDPDAERIAQLENEGLTHSDAVGAMEAEKLARQAEPAAGEGRDDLRLTYEVYDNKHGLFEGNLLVAVVGECVARSEQARELAQTIKTRVNTHTQLIAALESLVQEAKEDSQNPSLVEAFAKARRVLRLATDRE